MDSNQRWDVGEAIETMKKLAEFKPIWIEEPTSPDDVLGTVPLENTCTCRSPVKEGLGLDLNDAFFPQNSGAYLRVPA